jgi:hypothetical protein
MQPLNPADFTTFRDDNNNLVASKLPQLVTEATARANAAGDEYLAKGSYWYRCGNAHVQFTRRDTPDYRAFKKAGLIGNNYVVEIRHKHKGSQQVCLQLACANAAKKVLLMAGVQGFGLWDTSTKQGPCQLLSRCLPVLTGRHPNLTFITSDYRRKQA